MLRIFVFLFALHASIFSDIAGFFTGKVKDVGDLVSKVWGAFKHALTWIGGIFRNVGNAWGDLHFAFRALIAGMEHLAEGTYSAVRWLSGTLVPKWARKAISDAIDFAVRNIKTVAKRAETLANNVKSWAVGRFNSVTSIIKSGLANLRALVNAATKWVKDKGGWLWDTVRHPAKLVTWFLPSLVTPLMRWILDHLEAISLLVMRSIFSNIGKYATEIERALSTVL